MASIATLFRGLDYETSNPTNTDLLPNLLLNDANPIVAPPAQRGESSRFIQMNLQFDGSSTDTEIGKIREIDKKLTEALVAYQDRDYLEFVTLAMRIKDASEIVHFVVKGGTLELVGLLPEKNIYLYVLELECEPEGYGELIIDNVTSDIVNGSAATHYRASIPGDLPAWTVLQFVDTSLSSKVINDIRIGQYPRLSASTDYAPIIDASASAHGSAGSESDTIGGTRIRTVASTEWRTLAYCERPANKPAMSGKFDIFARLRDSTVIMTKPTGGVTVELNDYAPLQRITTRVTTGTSNSSSWGEDTRPGATLFLIVGLKAALSRITGVPAGWSLLTNQGHGSNTASVAVYVIYNSASRSGTETVTFSSNTENTITLIELPYMAFSGSLGDQFKGATGTGTAVDTGASAAITQAHDYVLTVCQLSTNGTHTVFSDGGTAGYQNGTEQYDSFGFCINTGNTNTTGTLQMTSTITSADWAVIMIATKMSLAAIPTDLSSTTYNYVVVPVSAAGNEGDPSDVISETIGGNSPQYTFIRWTAGSGTVNTYRIYWDTGAGYRYLATVDNKAWYLHWTETGATIDDPPGAAALLSQARLVVVSTGGGIGYFPDSVNISIGDSVWHLGYVGTATLPPIPRGIDIDYSGWQVYLQVKNSAGNSPNIDCDAFYFFPARHPQTYIKHDTMVHATQTKIWAETRFGGKQYAIRTVKDLFTELFTGSDAAAWSGANWTTGAESSGSVTILSNAGKMTASGAAYKGARALSTMTARGNQELTAQFTLADLGESYSLIHLRHGGSWQGGNYVRATNSYYVQIEPASNQYKLFKDVSSVQTQLGTTQALTFTTNPYKIRFRVYEQRLQVKIWLASASEPGNWSIDVTDTSLSTGTLAFSQLNGNASTARTITFDNVSVDGLTQERQLQMHTPFPTGPGNTGFVFHFGIANYQSDVVNAQANLKMYIRPRYKFLAGAVT